MDSSKFIVFTITLSIFFLALDFYSIFKWNKFVKNKNWNKLFTYIPIILGIFAFVGLIYAGLSRRSVIRGTPLTNFIFIYACFWYLPKIIIVLFMLIKDAIKITYKFFKLIFTKLFRKNKTGNNGSAKGRRDFLQTVGWSAAALPFATAGYGIAKTAEDLRIVRKDLAFHNVPEGIENFKIVQISDLHAGSILNKNYFNKIVANCNILDPDILVVTGDFVNFDKDEFQIISEFFPRFKTKYGIYGCFGNHDKYMGADRFKEFHKELENLGVKMLVNQNVKIQTETGFFQLAGVDNTGMKQNYADFDKAMNGLDPSLLTVMLCHDPTNWDKSIKEKLPVGLTLSGHTHGGQFGLNIFGAEISPAALVYKQWAGLYQYKDQFIYVNRGIGSTGPPFRVGIKPEITVINIKRLSNLA